MTKVRVTVAGHEIEVEADVDLAEVEKVALRLFQATELPAHKLGVGFDTTNDKVERVTEALP